MTTAQELDTAETELLALFPEVSGITADGELTIGGCSVVDLAQRFGTPSYLMDEVGLRRQIRRFIDGLAIRWPNSEVIFASKSLPCVAMYAIARSEGLSVDVAGGGELVMALAAGVDPGRIYLHGNAKSDAEITMALNAGVAGIIVDNFNDLDRLDRLATAEQGILIRMIPGISARTHASQATGGHESKFGLPVDQLRAAIGRVRESPLLRLDGIHVHVGSQILGTDQFVEAVESVAALGPFAAYDIGGGLGVAYTDSESAPTVDEYLDAVTEAARRLLPRGAKLMIEPGRAIVARAGVTLYTVNTVKKTGKTFVAVDGGMADNLDIALTGQRYEAVVANKMSLPRAVVSDVVGRQCESGDLLVGPVNLADPQVGDLIAMPVTGAYAYTLANNYNGALIPPIIFCANGVARVGAERQGYDDLLRLHQPALEGPW
ncbi:diaminopimelate decarboxylase [Cryobacterium sp. SO1]|uniref:diaminopimelate decarboxylase n=1 Tax=Cryobacterium sp. SO1 TaxID=1897061 RepID=UPI0010230900|nr:diaminopimelate decarboxylase [Cryobacterium sp. SO1]RZI34858.1 Diaminopimelate decarboxylase [Cryobacterium sp. SO1]